MRINNTYSYIFKVFELLYEHHKNIAHISIADNSYLSILKTLLSNTHTNCDHLICLTKNGSLDR